MSTHCRSLERADTCAIDVPVLSISMIIGPLVSGVNEYHAVLLFDLYDYYMVLLRYLYGLEGVPLGHVYGCWLSY
jgi:hypothetical protein